MRVTESAFQNEKFQSGGRLKGDLCTASPTFQRHKLMLIAKEHCSFYARSRAIRTVSELARVDAKLRAIGGTELPEFHENAAPGSEPGMCAEVGGLRI